MRYTEHAHRAMLSPVHPLTFLAAERVAARPIARFWLRPMLGLGAGLMALLACSGAAAQALPTLGNVTQVARGIYSNHNCAVTSAGAVRCWGENFVGQVGDGSSGVRREAAVEVLELSAGVASVAVGRAHSCALMQAGSIKCWGENSSGQLGDGTTTVRLSPVEVTGLGSNAIALSLGADHACAALQSGEVKCWGVNDQGQLGDGSTSNRSLATLVGSLGGNASLVAAGVNHSCAAVGSTVRCWGGNGQGQLGDGTTNQRLAPVAVSATLSSISSLDAGLHRTCLIDSGVAKCWGSNGGAALGDGTLSDRLVPTAVTVAGATLQKIDTGGEHTCGITLSNVLRCWGSSVSNQRGRLSIADFLTSLEISGIDSTVIGLGTNSDLTCAVLTGGTLKCVGDNSDAALGNGRTSVAHTPTNVLGLLQTSAGLTGSTNFSCSINAGGDFNCWGSSYQSQQGDGTITEKLLPGAAVTGQGFREIDAAVDHACAVSSAGAMKCWGANFFGFLGDGGFNSSTTPVAVSGLNSGVTSIATGLVFSCAVHNGAVKCWGHNGRGRLGDGTTTDHALPAVVTGAASGATRVAAGTEHACALVSGELRCWGANGFGQLGDASTTDRLSPIVVAGIAAGSVESMSLGGNHSCALTTAGGVKCWGNNAVGQLGDGSRQARTTPVDVVGLASGVMALAAGEQHTCALTVGGAVKCWGGDFHSQMGNGPLDNDSSVPVDVTGLASGVSAIGSGENAYHTCAAVSGGVKCWGRDHTGQIGDGGFSTGVPSLVVATGDFERRVASLTPAANATSLAPRSDASGRFVVFQSAASNLLGTGMDTNGTADIFRLDRQTGTAVRISVNTDGSQLSGGDAIEPSVSADGQFLVFVAPNTAMTKLWGEPKSVALKRIKGGGFGVFLRNMLTGTTQRVGTQPALGSGSNPVIAPDGESVVFTGTNTNPGQGAEGQDNVFRVRFSRAGNTLLPRDSECVSCKSRSVMGAAVADADGASRNAVVSADARWVAFETESKNALAASPSPCAATPTREILLRDMLTGTTQRVSPPSTLPAVNCGTTGSTKPSIDWSGLNIAFASDAALTPGSTSGADQVFLSGSGGSLSRLSQTAGGEVANGASRQPAISGDGKTIVFVSAGTNLDSSFVDTNEKPDVHAVRRERRTGGAERLSKTTSGAEANDAGNNPALNYNATLLVFDSAASNLVPTDSNGVVNDVYERVVPVNADVVFGSSFE